MLLKFWCGGAGEFGNFSLRALHMYRVNCIAISLGFMQKPLHIHKNLLKCFLCRIFCSLVLHWCNFCVFFVFMRIVAKNSFFWTFTPLFPWKTTPPPRMQTFFLYIQIPACVQVFIWMPNFSQLWYLRDWVIISPAVLPILL